MTIDAAGGLLRSGKLSCAELAEQALRQAERQNPALNSFITITAEHARKAAGRLDAELRQGMDRGPLHGIPIAHKDIIDTRGVRTTNGSKLFESHVPRADAAVVEQLEMAGAVSIGKLNLHELAYGVTSTNPHFGAVHNPWDVDCIPGGSSGGSGAAVAAGAVFMATGTDTGGSIRIPAAYCGTVGFKPTYGLVSRRGVQPLGVSLDHVGPLTRCVQDARTVMNALTENAGQVSEIPTQLIRVGVPSNYYFEGIEPEVAEAVTAATRKCEDAGARVQPVRVPDVDALNTVGRAILLAEAAAVYEKHLSQREMFGADVLALLEQGLLTRATEYVNAQRVRKMLVGDFQKVFEGVDILLTPTIPIVAPRIGQKTVEIQGEQRDTRLVTTRFVRGINVLGLPALSLPCGVSKRGLPIAVQLIGRAYEDAVVLGFGAALEHALGFQPRSFESIGA